MKGFQLSRYLKKWFPLILVFCVAATAAVCILLNSLQKYTASAVIEYTNEEAADGYAPDGTEIDLTEINSSANMAKVLELLDLEDFTLDQLCASISVEAIEDEQQDAIQAAVNEEGEEYTTKPTKFIISCTLGKPADKDMVRNVLNETLDVYFEDYGNKHISQAEISNVTQQLADTEYDYLEMVEMIDSALGDTISTLEDSYNKDVSFRSTQTGFSFSDLSNRFALLRDVNISRLYSQILGNQITKDKNLLLAKYRDRIANYEMDGEKAQQDIEEARKVIDAYVEKLRDSGNTDIDYNYILDDIYGYQTEDEEGNAEIIDRTVEYDVLLDNWTSYKNTYDYAVIDIAYCEFIIDIFEDPTGNNLFSSYVDVQNEQSQETEIVDEETAAANTAEDAETAKEVQTEKNDSQTDISEEELAGISVKEVSAADVEAEIAQVVKEMDELYEITTLTNSEFNEYLGAQGIKTLSSTSVEERFNLNLYIALVAVFFVVLGCGGAIILGRLGDIMEYLFLTDRQTGCMNRVSCDNFIQRHEKNILSVGFSCVNLQLLNQRELNSKIGRENTNAALKQIGEILKSFSSSYKNSFLAYNGGGQFWLFYEADGENRMEQMAIQLASMMNDSFSQYSLEYSMGVANAGREKTYRIRSLISKAAANKNAYKTGTDRNSETEEKA